jgi:hypothetical protein
MATTPIPSPLRLHPRSLHAFTPSLPARTSPPTWHAHRYLGACSAGTRLPSPWPLPFAGTRWEPQAPAATRAHWLASPDSFSPALPQLYRETRGARTARHPTFSTCPCCCGRATATATTFGSTFVAVAAFPSRIAAAAGQGADAACLEASSTATVARSTRASSKNFLKRPE